jgi:hypothetical protein
VRGWVKRRASEREKDGVPLRERFCVRERGCVRETETETEKQRIK